MVPCETPEAEPGANPSAARESDLVAEIDELARGDGTEADPEAQARLVQLRHALGVVRSSSGSHGPSSGWPPATPDLFAGVAGIPSVAPEELTGGVLSSGILHHGCLRVPGLLSSSEVDQLVEITERAIAAHDAWASGAPAADTAPWFVPFEPLPGYQLGYGRKFVRDAGGVWVVDSPRGMHELTRIFARAGLPETIGAHLGEHPLVSVKKWTLRRVPVDTSTDWHQDGAFLGAGIRTVNVWISLSHCGVDAPSLDLVPRRLEGLVETGTDGAYFDWSVGHGAAERMAGGPGILRPVFEPGDALLFDEVFLHRTGVSATMLEERYAIESWFFAPSCYPQRQIPVAL